MPRRSSAARSRRSGARRFPGGRNASIPTTGRRLSRALTEAIRGHARRWSATYRFRRDDGSYADMLDRGFIIRDAAGKAIRAVGAMADLTERHRAEAEIRRMQAELIHVSRLSAMGAMASTLAHELNQPLTALANFISGAKRIAERDCGAAACPDRRARRRPKRARCAPARSSAGCASWCRAARSRWWSSICPQLIEDAGVLAFVDEHALGVRHRLELDPAAQWVRADRIQIQQVLINLVRNAVEAMERERRARGRDLDPRRPGEHDRDRASPTPAPGIAPEHIDSLFSQFMTTKSGGMGIGLPISRTIVEAHGGTICGGEPAGGRGGVPLHPAARAPAQEPAAALTAPIVPILARRRRIWRRNRRSWRAGASGAPRRCSRT